MRAYLGLVRETAALAPAHGVPVGDYANFTIRTFVGRPDGATVAALAGKRFSPGRKREFYPSMTQDLLAGRALEVDDVFGDLGQAGVAVPRLRLVRDLLRGLDPGRWAGSLRGPAADPRRGDGAPRGATAPRGAGAGARAAAGAARPRRLTHGRSRPPRGAAVPVCSPARGEGAGPSRADLRRALAAPDGAALWFQRRPRGAGMTGGGQGGPG